ncbi:MAG TPA: CPBP family intramembrane glutamic endopeptidase [Candidatus Sulfotelmatobacter sp.]|nr:CPBP family intramembrane glutamic endopeptidase [Candidatus Sulfotelmatobacter sp.]
MLPTKPWRGDAVFFFIVAQITCFLLAGVAIGLLHSYKVAGFEEDEGFGSIIVGTLGFQGATWILMPLFFWLQDISWQDGIGFTKKKLLMAPVLAFGTLILVLPATMALLKASNWVLEKPAAVWVLDKLHIKLEPEAAVTLISNATSRPEQIYLAIFAVVLAPVAEEFIFRGVLFTTLKQHGFPKLAWIGVNLLFALIHADLQIFVPLFFLSLVLTWLYEITDSLLASFFTHALFNAANLVVLTRFSQ